MRCALTALVLVACSASEAVDAGVDAAADGGVDAGLDARVDAACGPGRWDSLVAIPYDRSCTVDTDCAIVLRHDCTMSGGLYTGVRVSDATRYETALDACETTVRPWGCGRAAQIYYDDGIHYIYYGSPRYTPVVHCVAHVCTTSVLGAVECGAYDCLPGLACGGMCQPPLHFAPGCVGATPDAGLGCANPAAQAACGDGGTCVDTDVGFTCVCP